MVIDAGRHWHSVVQFKGLARLRADLLAALEASIR